MIFRGGDALRDHHEKFRLLQGSGAMIPETVPARQIDAPCNLHRFLPLFRRRQDRPLILVLLLAGIVFLSCASMTSKDFSTSPSVDEERLDKFTDILEQLRQDLHGQLRWRLPVHQYRNVLVDHQQRSLPGKRSLPALHRCFSIFPVRLGGQPGSLEDHQQREFLVGGQCPP